MSNSPLVVYTQISPHKGNLVGKTYVPARNHVIDTITIHCFVGQVTVERAGQSFNGASPKSANYAVAYDGKIGLYVDECDRSWCTSSANNDNRAVTIEVASDSTAPYKVTDAALASLIALCADICRRNGIKALLWRGDKSLAGQVDKQNMTVHRWFTGKACPGDYLYNLHGYIADEVNKKLLEDSMASEQTPAWAEKYIAWCKEAKVMVGDPDGKFRPNDNVTRAEMAAIAYNLAHLPDDKK
ncbi:MAG: N-acetylmuramoyl-L-alanine amidase [Oscillospiraceae bacterium]|jgi:hypothetical protein|nr:N-acetylmuramoyl-L-alanine amidase [Oscillospiraceae bacterium]